MLTLWRPLGFGDLKKQPPKRTRLCAGIFRSGMLYRPGKSLKRCGKSSSLHSKKFFAWGVRVFYEWRHKWRTELRLRKAKCDRFFDAKPFQTCNKNWCYFTQVCVWRKLCGI